MPCTFDPRGGDRVLLPECPLLYFFKEHMHKNFTTIGSISFFVISDN